MLISIQVSNGELNFFAGTRSEMSKEHDARVKEYQDAHEQAGTESGTETDYDDEGLESQTLTQVTKHQKVSMPMTLGVFVGIVILILKGTFLKETVPPKH